MKKAILFDLDGTLADTLEDIRFAINHVLKEVNCREINEEECRSVVGRGLRNAIRGALWFSNVAYENDEIEILYYDLMVCYSDHPCDATKPYDGITDMLLRLKAKGYILGVLSNKSDELVIKIIDKIFPPSLFSYVHGMRENIPPKPDPYGILEFASIYKLKENDILYIGDSEVDYETINNLKGLEGAIVTWGFRSKEMLTEAGVSPLIDNINELEEYLNAAK